MQQAGCGLASPVSAMPYHRGPASFYNSCVEVCMHGCRYCKRALNPVEETVCTSCYIWQLQRHAWPVMQRLWRACGLVSLDVALQFYTVWNALWSPSATLSEETSSLATRVATAVQAWRAWQARWQRYEAYMRGIPSE